MAILATKQNKQPLLAKHEMFENFGGGETSKQGQAVETSSCQTLNNVGQFRQAFTFKDVQGWQFLTMKAAETLCIVCLPPEKHIS